MSASGLLFAAPICAAASLFVAGCGDDSPVFVFATEHFEYYRARDAPVPCEGTQYWLERHYQAYSRFFEVALPPGSKIRYELASDRSRLEESGCGNGATGCSAGTEILSVFSLVDHEIVHAVASLAGSPPVFLQEGIAVVLSGASSDQPGDPAPPREPLEQLIESDAFRAHVAANGFGVYRDAGTFVRFLLDLFGRAGFVDLYRTLPGGASRDAIEQAFLDKFRVSLSDLFAMWQARPATSSDDSSLHVVECSEPPLLDGQAVVDAGRCGYLTYSFGNAVIRPFEVSEGGAVLTASSAAQSAVRMFRCDGGDLLGGTLFLNDWGMDAEGPVQFLLDVPPGTYYVAMAQGEMAGVDDPFEVQLKLEGSLAPDGCTGPIAFSGAESRAYVVGRRDGEGCFACPSLGANVRFEVDGRADYYAPSGEPGAVALSSVELCAAGCGAGASQCAAQPVSGVSGALGTFPAGSTLDLRGTVRPESRLRGFGVRIRGTGG